MTVLMLYGHFDWLLWGWSQMSYGHFDKLSDRWGDR